MLVCHCHRVCDRIIRECVRAGARSPEDVGESCGAGTGCGGCLPTIESILQRERPEDAPAVQLISLAGKAA